MGTCEICKKTEDCTTIDEHRICHPCYDSMGQAGVAHWLAAPRKAPRPGDTYMHEADLVAVLATWGSDVILVTLDHRLETHPASFLDSWTWVSSLIGAAVQAAKGLVVHPQDAIETLQNVVQVRAYAQDHPAPAAEG